MTAPVILLCFFLAFCPLSVGTPLTCPPPFLNESAQQGSGRLCATLQLQTKLPCPSVNLSVRENEKLNPEKWHLKSLSLKVEKACSFMVFKQDEQRQHFPGGFNANIPINAINTQSEFLCICTEAAIREGVAIGGGRANGEDVAIEERETIRGRRDVIRGVAIEHVAGAESSVVVAGEAGVAVARGEPVGNEESEATGLFPIFFGLFAMLFV